MNPPQPHQSSALLPDDRRYEGGHVQNCSPKHLPSVMVGAAM